MSPLELVAALSGLACVLLTVRRHMLCWPIGLVMVALYAIIFYEAKLYSDCLLQIVYIGLQLYGWRQWIVERRPAGGTGEALEESEAPAEVPVRWLSGRATAWWVAGIAVGTLLWGAGMASYTDAALPFGDAFTTVASLVAQWLLAKRAVQSWLAWIAVDVACVPIYVHKELYLTAGLYAVFLGLAIAGFLAWRKAAAEPRP
ncbi:nicotinamide riboside transporter PnuC [Alienimonas chondri]|uniref:Nicotinamide riboside transporter PnuC n=1 Tax=Alienimonas chondri TaxID=2681879 RepID=A0ABX1VJH8_9PLAN|nr:nicotinamide riboside transporter PnuC [Alienimonas chondri]NNJ26956.1 Nicotinamide riboside transporter PnuC [Alienimonas chondri]